MRRIYFLIAVFVIGSLSGFSQKARYQSDIVFRISQQVTWPEKNESYKFVIGVVGSLSDFRSFQIMAIEKGEFQNNPIEIRYFEKASEIEDCHLLYISEECDIDMSQIVKKTKNHPTLIVSEKIGYGEMGAIINFVEKSGKLKIEFNQQQANKKGLEVTDKLKNIAIII